MSLKTKIAGDYKISKDNVGKVRSHLQIILCETSLVRSQNSLPDYSLEGLRVIEREVKTVVKLLPGDQVD